MVDPDGSGDPSNGGLFPSSDPGGLSDPGNDPGGLIDPLGVVGGPSDPSYIGVGGGLLSIVGGGMTGGETGGDLL